MIHIFQTVSALARSAPSTLLASLAFDRSWSQELSKSAWIYCYYLSISEDNRHQMHEGAVICIVHLEYNAIWCSVNGVISMNRVKKIALPPTEKLGAQIIKF